MVIAGLLLPLALGCLNVQADAIWDGGGADNNWTTADNWDSNVVPVAGETVTIGSAFTVNYDVAGGSLPGALTLNIDGTLSVPGTGVFRASGANITVSSTGELTGDNTNLFYDWNGATVTFEDGATMDTTWENKGVNVFNFELSSTGFTTLTPSRFFLSGGSGNISNATYNVDMASYTGGYGIISLVDYGTDFVSMDDSIFQTAGGLNVLNAGGAYAGSSLQWDDTSEAIQLVVIPEPSSLALLLMGTGFMLNRYQRRKSA